MVRVKACRDCAAQKLNSLFLAVCRGWTQYRSHDAAIPVERDSDVKGPWLLRGAKKLEDIIMEEVNRA